MNAMKKAVAVSVLSAALMLPGFAFADDMKPMTGDMGSGMDAGMQDMTMGAGDQMGMHDMTMGTGNETDMMMMDGMAYVPLRLLAETLGYTVSWNAADQSITLTYMGMGMTDKSGDTAMKDMYTVKVMLGSKDVMVGMDKKMLVSAPVLMDGKTYVMKDFIAMYLLAPYAASKPM